jgi:hypothetical protein
MRAPGSGRVTVEKAPVTFAAALVAAMTLIGPACKKAAPAAPPAPGGES